MCICFIAVSPKGDEFTFGEWEQEEAGYRCYTFALCAYEGQILTPACSRNCKSGSSFSNILINLSYFILTDKKKSSNIQYMQMHYEWQ